MKIHQQGKKVQLVTEIEKLARITECLSNSPYLSDRKLALELINAMEDLNRRNEK